MDSERAATLYKVSRLVIEEYVNLDFHFDVDSKCGSSTTYDYKCQVISLGLLYLNFKDAVHEGDGDRVLRIWKYFLLSGKLLVTEIMLVLVRHITVPLTAPT